MYQSGTSCSFIWASQSPFRPLPFRTDSMILKDSCGSMPFLIRNSMMSSRVQMAVWMVAVPSLISFSALPCQTSVPWDSPEMRTRSEKPFGFAWMTMFMAKSVPNSGIPRAPSLQPRMSSGVTFRAEVFWNRLITSLESSGMSLTGSMPVRSCSMRIMVGSWCPRMSSFRRLWSIA